MTMTMSGLSARGVLEKTSPRIVGILLERRRALARIAADERFNETHRREQAQAAEKTAREKIDAVRAEAVGAHEKMLQALGEPLMENRSVEEQMLAELKEQRAWSRYSFALTSGKEPTEVVRQASEGGEAAGIRALASELPSYLESGGWDARHVEAIVEQIRTAEEPFLSPEERAVRETEVEAKDGWGRLTAAFAHADMDLEGASGGAQATQLPTWEGGLIPVSDEAAG
jgi:hypothetical protein